MILGQKISGSRAKKLVDKGAMLIDIRGPVAYRDGTLPGARNVSLRQISTLFSLPKTSKMIFFGETNDDDTLKSAINYMVQFGFSNVYSLGAKENWDKL